MKSIKQKLILFLLAFIIIPVNVFAYSDRILIGGENIGITLNANGILVVGTYDIEGTSPAEEAGLKPGDTIVSINDKKVTNIDEMASEINNLADQNVSLGYIRDGKSKKTIFKLIKDENNVYKTGLYVKDSITGIGTLTYIDPETKIFGALGHEITEQSSGKILEVKDGKIFDSTVTGVIPSSDGNPGEKSAKYDTNDTVGEVFSNTKEGVFGNYTSELPKKDSYKVASIENITKGQAHIFTVLKDHEIKAYEINITEIVEKDETKNFVFEIVDKELLNKTNGIIQGMSGSPIIQGDYIIGAVTHVVVDNPHKGYGILITNMLEEGEK